MLTALHADFRITDMQGKMDERAKTPYVVEDSGQEPGVIRGKIRLIFDTVIKTKHDRAAGRDQGEKAFSRLLEAAFAKGLIDHGLETPLFNAYGVTNRPHHGDVIDEPARTPSRDEIITTIQESLKLMRAVLAQDRPPRLPVQIGFLALLLNL